MKSFIPILAILAACNVTQAPSEPSAAVAAAPTSTPAPRFTVETSNVVVRAPSGAVVATVLGVASGILTVVNGDGVPMSISPWTGAIAPKSIFFDQAGCAGAAFSSGLLPGEVTKAGSRYLRAAAVSARKTFASSMDTTGACTGAATLGASSTTLELEDFAAVEEFTAYAPISLIGQ